MVKRDDFEAHLAHVVHAGGAHALGDHLGLFDDLLDGELADDAAQVAFHDEADEAFALVGRFGEELLGRGEDGFLVGADLDLRDGFDGDGDALLGVEVLLRGDVEAHELERELAGVFDDGKDDGAAAFDDARAAEAVDDDGFVRAGFAKHLAHETDQGEGGEDDQTNNDGDGVRHIVPLSVRTGGVWGACRSGWVAGECLGK